MVRQVAGHLRPPVLELGLYAGVEWLLEEFQSRCGLDIDLDCPQGDAISTRLTPDLATVAFRCLQESLTNITRHAQASQAKVKIDKLDGYVCMRIRDNGKGFQEQRVFHAKKGARLGLLGMSERLDMVGGKFTISSAPGKGTTVLAQVPLIDPPSGGGGEVALIASARTKH